MTKDEKALPRIEEEQIRISPNDYYFVIFALFLVIVPLCFVSNHFYHKVLDLQENIAYQESRRQLAATNIPEPLGKDGKLRTMMELGIATGTDKIYHHGYHRFYPIFLEALRDKPISMVEIGYLNGDSHRMWNSYFPKGRVYFIEKDGDHQIENGFGGDQSSKDDLRKFLASKNMTKSLDIIVDDGSHHPSHQLFSFKYLYKWGLKPGGIYIIEDIEMSYWIRGDTYGFKLNYGRDSPKSLISQLKSLIDLVNREFQPKEKPFHSIFGPAIDDTISGIFFGMNCVIILKMTEEEQSRYFQRRYRNDKYTTLRNDTI